MATARKTAKKKPARKKAAAKPRRPRRPNVEPVADVEPSRCPACGSTKRTAYAGTRTVQAYQGSHNGKPYDRIIRRRTQCAACLQFRIDRSFEADPPAKRPKR